jgi:hypothetical protein
MTMSGEALSEKWRRTKPDLNLIAGIHGPRFTVMIDISCPYGRTPYGKKTFEKVSFDKLEKYARLAQEVRSIGDLPVEIIPVIVSSLGAVHEQ